MMHHAGRRDGGRDGQLGGFMGGSGASKARSGVPSTGSTLLPFLSTTATALTPTPCLSLHFKRIGPLSTAWPSDGASDQPLRGCAVSLHALPSPASTTFSPAHPLLSLRCAEFGYTEEKFAVHDHIAVEGPPNCLLLPMIARNLEHMKQRVVLW